MGSQFLHRIGGLGYTYRVSGKSIMLCSFSSLLTGGSKELLSSGYVFATTCNYRAFSSKTNQLLDYNNDGPSFHKKMHSGLAKEPQNHHFRWTQIANDKSTANFDAGQSVSMANGQSPMIGCSKDDNHIANELVRSSNEEFTDINDASICAELDNNTSEELRICYSSEKECQDQSTCGDFYEEVKITAEAGEPLMPRSLLDLAVEDFMHKENEQGHLLWQRFKKAAALSGGFTCESVMATWLGEEKEALRSALIYSILAFRSWKKNKRALELFDWVMTKKPFEMTGIDHAIYMDLVGKIAGCKKASKYLLEIPKPQQSSMIYSVLLAAYLDHDMEDNAKKLLLRARSLGLTEQAFLFNQVIFFYKGKGRISDVACLFKEMEELGVVANLSTYNIILDLRARKGDVSRMRNLLKYLEKETNINLDAASYSLLAKGYINAGLYDRAETAVKQIETSPYPKKQVVYRWLLKLYARLKRDEDLERVWDMLKNVSNSLVDDYSIMVESLGKAGEVERAEEVFKEGVRKFGIKRLHQYHTLISVFVNHGMTQKTEALVEKLTKDAFNPGSATYHQLIELYVKSGDEKKAMETLRKAQDAGKIFSGHKPWYASYLTMLQMFGNKGDIEHAEVIVKELKGTGYSCNFQMYNALLKAYVKAKTMPYGFLDRMRADGAIPNSHMRKELNKVMDNRRELYEVNGARRYLF